MTSVQSGPGELLLSEPLPEAGATRAVATAPIRSRRAGSALRLARSQPQQVAQPQPVAQPQRVRIADAATRCVARRGVTKTTLDDVAREAGCSRATVYRTFPGGKEEVIAAVVDTEVARLFSAVAVAMGGAEDFEDAVVAGIVAYGVGHRRSRGTGVRARKRARGAAPAPVLRPDGPGDRGGVAVRGSVPRAVARPRSCIARDATGRRG